MRTFLICNLSKENSGNKGNVRGNESITKNFNNGCSKKMPRGNLFYQSFFEKKKVGTWVGRGTYVGTNKKKNIRGTDGSTEVLLLFRSTVYLGK